MSPNSDLYCQQECVLGEGPLWVAAEQALYWIDIGQRKLYRKKASARGPSCWSLPDYPGALAQLSRRDIGVAMSEGLHRIELDSGAVQLLRTGPSRRAGTRFNDGKVDPAGRFWVGSMQNNFGPMGEPLAVERADGALYRFDTDDGVTLIEEKIGIANTLAWSPNHRWFYFADSAKGQIYQYEFDNQSGEIRNKRLFFESADHGTPDGSAMDTEGCLWNARWDAGIILRLTPRGEIDRTIQLPVPRPTSCCFGGSDLEILYVTTAKLGLTLTQLRDYPLSGSVFAISGLGQGMPVRAFGGQ